MEKNKSKSLYNADYLGWISAQVNFLRNKDYDNVDTIHLLEEMESLGNSEKSKLESHLMILMLHLLKIKFQPERESRSWNLSIKNAKYHCRRTLEKNPSLKRFLPEILNDAYFSARLGAAQETGLSEKIFQEECPWTINEILK